MKRALALVVILTITFSCIPFLPGFSPDEEGDISIQGRNYRLVWADEFEEGGLPDPSKWAYETGYVRNDEAQYYTDARPENCFVSNGILHLTARNDSFQGHPITSASIETFGKYSYRYGFVQVRAKMPHRGDGTWPAIWSMGVNRPQVGWPSCGEIDIMEWVGRAPNTILGSVFFPTPSGGSASRNFPFLLAAPELLTEQFHDYAVEWDSTKIRYYIDGIQYVTYYRHEIGEFGWAPFTQDHYLKLNLAMGGIIPPIGGGGPIDYTRFPYTFEVDYVRHYERVE